MEAGDNTASSAFTPSRGLPIVRTLRSAPPGWFTRDLMAGLTLAAYAIPVSMAYASLAGVPPQAGIACYLLGCIAYALFGTSRQLAIGPTSAIAMLVGTTIADMAIGDPARWTAIASLTALVVGVISFIAWLLRLSALMCFVSETILLGFKAGAALTIGLTQLPKLFGVPGGGDSFFERVGVLLSQWPQINFTVLAVGLAAVALLLAGDRLLPGRPVALAVVVLWIVVNSVTSLRDHGVASVGAIPSGLPSLQVPPVRLRDIDGVIPLAFACFLLGYIESVSAARTLASRHGDEVDARQELLGLAAANVAVAFGQGFPVAGGLSQSAVNDKAGAQTPVSLIVASGILALCLLFLTDLLKNLPSVVLAAIVLMAVKGLIDVAALRRLRRASRLEFRIALVALAGVLLLGILKGVMLASIISLILLIAGAARPHIAFLGRIPGTTRYSDLARHPDNEVSPHVLVFRVEASLLYFNIDHVRSVVWDRVRGTPAVRLVICDLSNAPRVDVAGARFLSTLDRELAARKITLRLVLPHAQVRDLLRAEGLEEHVGYFGRHLSIDQAIAEFDVASQTANRDSQ